MDRGRKCRRCGHVVTEASMMWFTSHDFSMLVCQPCYLELLKLRLGYQQTTLDEELDRILSREERERADSYRVAGNYPRVEE